MKKKDKNQIVRMAIEGFSKNIKSLEKSLLEINEAINDAPGAMQSHSDTTRSQLTSIINVTQKTYEEKVTEFKLLQMFAQKDLSKIDNQKVGLGVIVILKKNEAIENYFLIPGGSSIKLEFENVKIICITPISPLGQVLIGKVKGQAFLLKVGNFSHDVKIIDLI